MKSKLRGFLVATAIILGGGLVAELGRACNLVDDQIVDVLNLEAYAAGRGITVPVEAVDAARFLHRIQHVVQVGALLQLYMFAVALVYVSVGTERLPTRMVVAGITLALLAAPILGLHQ